MLAPVKAKPYMFALISGKLLKHKKEVVWIAWLQGQACMLYLPVISYIKNWNTYVAQKLFQVKEFERICSSKCCHLVHCMNNMYSQKENSKKVAWLIWVSQKGFYISRSDKVASPTTMMLSKANNIKLHQKDANQSQPKMTEVLYSQRSRMQCMVLGSGLGYIGNS